MSFMEWSYPVSFWLVWIGIPALWVGRYYRSWTRGLTVAAMVVLSPLGFALGLAARGGAPSWSNPAVIDSWVTSCVDIGAPAGYFLGILVPLAVFQHRDRRPHKSDDARLHQDGCPADEVGAKEGVGISSPAGPHPACS